MPRFSFACLPALVAPVLFLVVAIAPDARAQVVLEVDEAQVSAADMAKLGGLFPGVDVPLDLFQAETNRNLAAMRQNLIDEVNGKLAGLEVGSTLRAMANAAASTTKGLGFDYATDPSYGSLTLGVNGTANKFTLDELTHPDDIKFDAADGQLPVRGVAAALLASASMPLSSLPLPRWRLFDPGRLTIGVSAMRTGQQSFGDYSLRYSAWGLRASYHLLRGHALARRGLLRWGGLNVGLGVSQAFLDVDLNAELPGSTVEQDTDITGDGRLPLSLRLLYNGAARLAMSSRVTAVPIELWTHAQLGYLFTVYAGGALDFNAGHADFDANATQNVRVQAYNRSDQSRPPVSIADDPQARLTADERAGVQTVDVRGFGGLQVNLLALAIFAQGSADTAGSLSVSAGARAFW